MLKPMIKRQYCQAACAKNGLSKNSLSQHGYGPRSRPFWGFRPPKCPAGGLQPPDPTAKMNVKYRPKSSYVSLAQNPMTINSLVTSTAPNRINLYDVAMSMAPKPIN